VSTTHLDPILKIDSGDTISYPNTWSHFLNQMQPGVPVETLAKLRLSNPGTARIRSSARFTSTAPNPAMSWKSLQAHPSPSTGEQSSLIPVSSHRLLPQDFPEGQVKYLKLDLPT